MKQVYFNIKTFINVLQSIKKISIFFILILSQVNKFTKKTVEFVDPKNDHEKLLQSYV